LISSNKKRDLTIFSAILLLLFLSFLPSYDVRQQNEMDKNLYRFLYVFTEILSFDIGLSHHENLREPFEEKYSNTIIKLAASVPAIIKYKFFGPKLERLDLDVKHLEWQEILSSKDANLNSGTLTDPNYVKAEIRFQDQVYKVKIKLKGYGLDHRLGSKRFSLMVSLSGGKTLLGFSKFSLQKPLARYFPFDYIFQRVVSDSNNLGPVKDYANIYVNGENWGIMNLEESLTKEFLEKKESKQSIVVRYPNMFDENIWEYNKLTEYNSYPWYRLLESNFYIHLYDDKKYLEDPRFRKYFSYIQEQSVFDQLDIVDTKKMAEVFLLSSIWGNWHTLLNYNLRFYFNPYTLKLEPIVTDQSWPVAIQDNAVQIFNHFKLPLIFQSLLQQPDFQEELRNNFFQVAARFDEIDKYSAESEKIFPLDRTHNIEFLKSNISYLSENIDLFFSPENFASRSILPTKENQVFSAPPPNQEQAKNFLDHIYPRHFSDGYLDVYNLLPDDTKILKVFSNGEEIPFTPIILKGYFSDPLPVRIDLNLNGIRDNEISLLTEYNSNQRITPIKSSIDSEGTFNPLTTESYFCENVCTVKNGEYFFNPGIWSIEEPIILDGNVNIPPGTTLNFQENAYMIIKGSLIAVGTPDLPINFSSINQSWKGLYIINASKGSLLEYVQIENLNALTDGLLNLTGGVNFYNSDLIAKNSIIKNIFAEDALNIVKSDFTLEKITITNAVSDAVDSDFSQGLITSSTFENIKGDALDFSGSMVTISLVETNNIGDKSISAGEQSNLYIEESRLRNTAIGITSKDGSQVTIKNTIIEDYDLFGVMSYVKKDFYVQKPSIELLNCTVDDGAPYLRQTGSLMIVNGEDIPESKFDVDLLYSQPDNNLLLIQ
jgi:hypothetical protein